MGTGAYYLLKQKVIDGTPCSPESYDICVNGRCRSAGCDHILGSDKKPDTCGVCGGNNSTCRLIHGRFDQSHIRYGYNSVSVLPANSTNVDVRQFAASKDDNNYLALRDDTGRYILNGDFVVSMFRKTIQYGGTTIEYSGSNLAVERINATKPIDRVLFIDVLSVGNLMSPEISFEYALSLEPNEVEPLASAPSFHKKQATAVAVSLSSSSSSSSSSASSSPSSASSSSSPSASKLLIGAWEKSDWDEVSVFHRLFLPFYHSSFSLPFSLSHSLS